MCGIVGLIHFDQRSADIKTIKAMTQAVSHRGPDGEGIWVDGHVAFGHRRLAIRDLSENGKQPFFSECGRIVTVYNGELYNVDSILGLLEKETGFKPRTTCDTEIIPAAWLAWGPAMVEKLEGIFAFVLFDRKDGDVFMARDAAGVKPLYYNEANNSLRFASEIKPFLTDPLFKPKFCPDNLNRMLAMGYPSPNESILVGVRQLPAGSWYYRKKNGIQRQRYWFSTCLRSIDDIDEAAERVLSTLSLVVGDQVISDRPVAILQSGGIDSSLISSCLPRNSDVTLHNVSFQDDAFNEAVTTAQAAKWTGRELTSIMMENGNDLNDFKSMVDAVDGSLGDSSAFAMFKLCRSVRSVATVALSGDGADEFFAGYPTYRASALAASMPNGVRKISATFHRIFASLNRPHSKRIGHMELLMRLFGGLMYDDSHVFWRRYLLDEDRQKIYGPALRCALDQDPFDQYRGILQDHNLSIWDKCLLADQLYYLPADMLVKVDRTSMAHGLEVRVPFLDKRMMLLAGEINQCLLADYCGNTKKVLRHAAKLRGAPRDLIRMKKKGFNVPINALLASTLRPLADRFFDSDADILSPFTNPDGIRRLWADHQAGQKDNKHALWTLLVLSTWASETF